MSIIAYVSSFQDQPHPPGAVAAGAGHVPGHRGGAGLDLRHAQQEDGPLSGEHRDGLRRHPEAARWDKCKKKLQTNIKKGLQGGTNIKKNCRQILNEVARWDLVGLQLALILTLM